jgi:hypothetical protein
MAKYKTIKDNVNIYNKSSNIVKTVPVGTVVDIKRNEYTQIYDKKVIYGFTSEDEYLITEWNGIPSVEKVQIKKKKEK